MSRRVDKVNELLRQEIGLLIMRELRDPRLPTIISVTAVETTGDLRHAKVFVSVLAPKESRDESLEVLNLATGFLRKQMRGRVFLRNIPGLTFVLDESLEKAAHLLKTIKEVSSKATPGEPS